jgi:hypothetical protein
MGEQLHELLQDSNTQEYTEYKHSEGSNVDIDKEGDEPEESILWGEDDGRKKRK